MILIRSDLLIGKKLICKNIDQFLFDVKEVVILYSIIEITTFGFIGDNITIRGSFIRSESSSCKGGCDCDDLNFCDIKES